MPRNRNMDDFDRYADAVYRSAQEWMHDQPHFSEMITGRDDGIRDQSDFYVGFILADEEFEVLDLTEGKDGIWRFDPNRTI